MIRNSTQAVTGWKIIALAIVALGIGMRFVNLGKKPYWMDEAFSSLRVSGYLIEELRAYAFSGREITVADLQKYQHLNPDHGLLNTVHTLATDDPHQPPLFFVIARIWAGIVGDSPAAMRALAAAIAIFTIPAVYWLCMELFQSQVTAWVAMVLMAISPFQLVYAQEARAYSFLTVITLTSCAALLRAHRLQRIGQWFVYAVTVGLGLYSHLFFWNVLFAHGIYMLICSWRKNGIGWNAWMALKSFLLSVGIGVLAFIPWILTIVFHSERVKASTTWLLADLELADLIKSWSTGISSVFVDPKDGLVAPWSYPVRLPTLLLIGYALYFLWRTAPMQRSLLVFALIFCTAISLMVPDLFIGGRRSSVSRYWVPAYVGLQIAVAYLLGTQLSDLRPNRRWFWRATTGTVVVAGMISCVIIVQAETWQNKGSGLHTLQAAQVVNQVERPLLIGSCDPHPNIGHFVSLINMLHDDVRLRITQKSLIPSLPQPLGTVFVLNPSNMLRQGLVATDRNRTLVQINKLLWRLEENRRVTESIPSSVPQ